MQTTVGDDHLAHIANRNVICVLIEMLFNLLKKHFWCYRTKINDFGITTFHGQKGILFKQKQCFEFNFFQC